MATPSQPLPAHARRALEGARTAMLHLHKTLLDHERDSYERANGQIGSSGELLQLLLHDPWFDWLRALSALIAEMDHMLSSREPRTEQDADALLEQARMLLRAEPEGNDFQRRYSRVLQDSPDVVVSHGAAMTVLGQPQ